MLVYNTSDHTIQDKPNVTLVTDDDTLWWHPVECFHLLVISWIAVQQQPYGIIMSQECVKIEQHPYPYI